jgi:glycosyltransferase involved in cell wall biosynthesis
LNALFLSRLHPKKGLINLIEAWSIVRPDGWDLTIAGPDDGGHRQVIEQLIRTHDLAASVRLVGSVPDADKWALYAASDLFVLPTFSENFGIVIAEALVSGLPVITTKGAPWSGLHQHGCGWWIEVGVEPLVDALTSAIRLSSCEREALGARGRAYIERDFSWAGITRKMLRAYEWLLDAGDRPSFVHEA